MKIKLAFIFVLLLTVNILSQKSKEKWVEVVNQGQDKVLINISGIENFKGEDIYVWTLTEHATPIVIESIEGKIYKTNTYYLFNKKLKKYSILYLIYYDKDGNVLGSFDYGRNSKVEIYQYNYPIFKGSVEQKILDKCISVIEKQKK